ncbi:MAG: hypothetical protein U5J97_02255 [Trueperaceae bacterium]|nr:hypothetical protein [Trueperaceae bacterium]
MSLVQSVVGNAASLGGVDDRARRRSQHVGVAHRLEAVDDRLQVDHRAVEQGPHQRDRLLPRGEPAGLVTVAVDDVVDVRLVAVDRLAVADGEADHVLQLDRQMLDDVTRIRSHRHALQEAARRPDRASVLVDAGHERTKAIGQARHHVAGAIVQVLDVQPQVDRRIPAVIVGTAQGAVLEDLHSFFDITPDRLREVRATHRVRE